MRKLVASVGVGASLLVLASAALADGYTAPRGYERTFSWTGFYIGAQGGAGWGTSDDNLTAIEICTGGQCTGVIPFAPKGLLRDSYGINGFHGGGTIGYNLQTGPVVLGVEADLSASDITGDGNCIDSFGVLFGPASCHTKLTSFGTVTGRLGFAATERALVFVKAGGAWGNFDRSVIAGSTGPGPGSVVGATASVNETRWGVTVGTGVEYALFGNWSAKVEYDFMDFGTHNEKFHFTGPTLPGGSIDLYSDDREQVHVVRFGLNYRFGGDRDVGPLK
jgi:outer membrane immunogenic protein